MDVDTGWMRQALGEAQRALSRREVPVGAVVVHEGRIIGRGYNQTETLQDPTAHAEMIAISAAASTLRTWRLTGCSIYVTLEPCSMCAGALVLARVERLVYGAADPKAGACGSLRNIVQDHRLNHHVQVVSGIMEEEASQLLRNFFRQLRDSER
jgi:tRNA(adenine34) deaminase